MEPMFSNTQLLNCKSNVYIGGAQSALVIYETTKRCYQTPQVFLRMFRGRFAIVSRTYTSGSLQTCSNMVSNLNLTSLWRSSNKTCFSLHPFLKYHGQPLPMVELGAVYLLEMTKYQVCMSDDLILGYSKHCVLRLANGGLEGLTNTARWRRRQRTKSEYYRYLCLACILP